MKRIVLAACVASVANAQPSSIPVRDAQYTLTANAQAVAQVSVHVEATFSSDARGILLLSLPAWTPGAYEISNFARKVSSFDVRQGPAALRWDKLDYDTWRVLVPEIGTPVTVSLDVAADTMDNAMTWAKKDFALVNGTNVFLYPEGQGFDWAAKVRIVTEPGWKIATGLERAADSSYRAPTYHELVDNPIFVGRFDLDSVQIGGRWMRLATYPVGSMSGQRRLDAWANLQRMVTAETAVFGEVPWRDYTLIQIADPAEQGYSGLEHASSHVDIVSPLIFGRNDLWSLWAHEIFHAWNVKRLRPAEMVPYRYDAPQPTTLLWVSEGITDYYADLAEVRGRVIDSTRFLQLTGAKMDEVDNAPPTSLEDASVNTWIHPQDGSEYLYYPKGSLAGLALDIMIRDATNNAQSLDDVMRSLYAATYKQGRGFTTSDWWSTVARIAGRDFGDFATRHIDGREPFPWRTVLPLAGMRLREDTTKVPRLGVSTVTDSAGVVVVSALPGSAAEAAGVRAGDVLLTVGNIEVKDENFAEKYRTLYAKREGATVPIVVRRGKERVTLTGKVVLQAVVNRTLEYDAAAGAKAVRIRSGILTGK